MFSTGDTAGTGQVESLRQDPSQENIRLTELMLNNLAEDAGQYVASLPESLTQNRARDLPSERPQGRSRKTKDRSRG